MFYLISYLLIHLLVSVYLDAGAAGTTPTTSTLNFAYGSQVGDRSWNVKVTQVPCGSLTE